MWRIMFIHYYTQFGTTGFNGVMLGYICIETFENIALLGITKT